MKLDKKDFIRLELGKNQINKKDNDLRDTDHFTKSPLEAAWLIGFFEGDGSFNISRKK
jgi:hypothetical protein